MIILGIDPGTTRIGYGVVLYEKGAMTCIDYGLIENSGTDRVHDLRTTEEDLNNLIDKYKPTRAAVERLFFTKNQKTAMAVSEMRGVILLTLGKKGIPVDEFTPQQVKQAVSSYGGASKNQVEAMVRMLLKIKSEIKPDDAADALAVAICGACQAPIKD